MIFQIRKLMGCVLFSFLIVSFYLSFVGIIGGLNALYPRRLIVDMELGSSGETDSATSYVFGMGELLNVSFEFSMATNYILNVRDENGSILIVKNDILKSQEESVLIPLDSPPFSSNEVYTTTLVLYANNYPVVGAFLTDTTTALFMTEQTNTKLSFYADYDSITGSLYCSATLSNLADQPITGEEVGFFIQRADTKRITEGWVPLGKAVTDKSGNAVLNVVLALPVGDYLIKSFHGGNEDFASSEKTKRVSLSAGSIDSLTKNETCETLETPVFADGLYGNINVDMSTNTPYVLLPISVEAQYSTIFVMGTRVVAFFLDYTNSTPIGAAFVDPVGGGPYLYETSLIWSPTGTGQHDLIVVVLDGGDIYALIEFLNFGTGVLDSETVQLEIQPCPTNTVLEWSSAVYGERLPITVALSKPRPYEEVTNGFYAVSTLAPTLVYDGVTYVIDEEVNATLVEVYVNGTFFSNSTDELGRISISLNLSNVEGSFVLDFNVNVDSDFYYGHLDKADVFSKVDVYDASDDEGLFNSTYSVNGAKETPSIIYVGAANHVVVVSSLFNLSISDLPVGSLLKKLIWRHSTDASGRIFASGGASWFAESDTARAIAFYNLTSSTAPAISDVNDDGTVDIFDLIGVSGLLGKGFGDEEYDWQIDLNADEEIDLYDMILVTSYFGGTIDYLQVPELTSVNVHFDSGQTLNLDSTGFVEIPSGASSFNMSLNELVLGATVEFFATSSDVSSATNILGEADGDIIPLQTGVYSIHVTHAQTFKALVNYEAETNDVLAQLNLAEYFFAFKRPINLTTGYTPEEPTLDDQVTLVARCIDEFLLSAAEGLRVDFYIDRMGDTEVFIYMGYDITNSSGIATFLWHPRDWLYGINPPFFFLKVVSLEGDYNRIAETSPLTIDCRYPTNLEFLGEEVFYAYVGDEYTYGLDALLTNSTGWPIEGKLVSLYRNDIFVSKSITVANGIAHWDCKFDHSGTYYFKAIYLPEGAAHYRPSPETRVIAVVQTIPVFIRFDVQPREFTPPAHISLIANVTNAATGDPQTDFPISFYEVDEQGDESWIQTIDTDQSGVATLDFFYGEGTGTHAFRAESADTVMVSPVVLTVSEKTRLVLNVQKEDSGYRHNVSGVLLKESGTIVDQRVKILVNGTVKGMLITDEEDGTFNQTLELPAVNRRPTKYDIQAVFEGSEFENATAYAFTPNGTRYALCTTLNYGYRPASNTTQLTVKPQATDTITTTKTPEQLQQEAMQNGTLSIWHEFSWTYPWHRIHYVSWRQGAAELDMGIAVLPFADTLLYSQELIRRILDLLPRVIWSIVATIGTAEFLSLIVASYGPYGFLAALGLSIGTKMLKLAEVWDSVNGLISVYIGSLFSTVLGLLRISFRLVVDFLELLMGIKSLAEFGFGKLYSIISIPVNLAYQSAILQRLDQLGAF